MPDERESPTLAQVVTRAVEVCDDSSSDGLAKLRKRFGKANEPIAAVGDVEQRLNDAIGPPEPDEDDAALTMRARSSATSPSADELGEDSVGCSCSRRGPNSARTRRSR